MYQIILYLIVCIICNSTKNNSINNFRRTVSLKTNGNTFRKLNQSYDVGSWNNKDNAKTKGFN